MLTVKYPVKLALEQVEARHKRVPTHVAQDLIRELRTLREAGFHEAEFSGADLQALVNSIGFSERLYNTPTHPDEDYKD